LLIDDLIVQVLSDRQAATSLIAGGVKDVPVPNMTDARRQLDAALDAPPPGPRDWDRIRLAAIMMGRPA
jgi:hypothetical protein